MKVVYIAGKYRDARGEYFVRQNIRMAEDAALFVWDHGGVAMCPHKNTAGFGGARGLSDDVWLRGDLALLQRCDAVMAIPGWEESEGAQVEVIQAESWEIPVFTDYECLEEYLRGVS